MNPRQMYQRITSHQNRQSNKAEAKGISDKNAVIAYRESPAYKLVQEFVNHQRKGQVEMLQVEIGSLNGLNLLRWLGAFLKYTYMVQENRAYRKIDAFLDETVRRGEAYEQRRAKRSQKSADKSS